MTDLISQYQQHPFRVLGAAPRSTREQLITLQTEAALFGQAEAAETALSALLHPDHRLKAEMTWFPMTPDDEIRALFSYVEHGWSSGPPPVLRGASFLALFNHLRLCMARLPLRGENELTAALHSLAVTADALLPRQVMWELNEDRKISGFPLITSLNTVDTQLAALLRDTVTAVLSKSPVPFQGSAAERLAQRLKKECDSPSSPWHNSYLLRIASDTLLTTR